ncbi:hypothetical protein KZZ08_22835 [Roseovarius mucosus]|uniref:hypothetical protein n=1 Tax=Roseovarius mucosus TaxID=215743 RepID=UPI001C5D9AFA|nr:hypothetical protein [Roseovarius mucosus]MBW4976451.1 hypothetical protein [Roseovarius mucosus]
MTSGRGRCGVAKAVIKVDGRQDPLVVRLDGPKRTFHLQTDPIRTKLCAELDPLNEDLLEIAATVFAADSAVKRGGETRQRMGQGWHRSFDFRIPVRNPTFWNRKEVMQALVDAVSFLTDDHLSFTFSQKAECTALEPFLDFAPDGAAFDAEEVILFSGGLDSFAGALEALSTSSKKVILLTHRSAQKAISRQVKLGEYLAHRFEGRVLHIHVLARRVGQEASDSSQRSRSFLFAALGQLVAKSFGAQRLSFYENGVISHNLPISSQVVGTMATRTTHPLSIRKLNALMKHLGPDHVSIENQYCWLTKRDVVERIAQHNGTAQIPISVSCTSIREQTTLHTHCGACSQCLDRRFALLAAGLGSSDFATDYATDVLYDPRYNLQSRTIAVEWTRHALSLCTGDQRAFLMAFGTEFARIADGHPEQSKQSVLDQSVAMHMRHGKNVEQVLEGVLRERPRDILHGKLSGTSLVALIIGQQRDGLDPSLTAPPAVETQMPETKPEDEVDLVLNPEDPLRVVFANEDGSPVVNIRGLCVLTGPPAIVPTDLKPTFLEDLITLRSPSDYRYVASGTLAARQSKPKSTIRQQVKRCRHIISESYKLLHGEELASDRFIQTRSPQGYRLAPSIVLIDEES